MVESTTVLLVHIIDHTPMSHQATCLKNRISTLQDNKLWILVEDADLILLSY